MKGGSHKQSILIILSTNEMYPEFKPQTLTLKKYIEHLSTRYNVDLAGISSMDDFSNYEDTLAFKYKINQGNILQLEYINLFQQLPSGNKFRILNILRMVYLQNLDLRKRRKR